jgi:O-antigen/teichoic acid export membrane protein
LNRFFGTIVNASYGIAQQVFGSIQFIAASVTNAMAPQIMKAEGNGDRQRMLYLSELLSKYSVLLLATVTIPIVFEMPSVLQLWLGKVPANAVLLCRFILLTALCDQITIGLGTANQAIGRIRNYSITVNTIKVLTLPGFWLCLYLGYSIDIAMFIYLGVEMLCALTRLPFLKYTAGLSIRHFLKHVFAKVALPLVTIAAVCWLFISYIQMPFRFLLTGIFTVVVATASGWYFALESPERDAITKMIKRT